MRSYEIVGFFLNSNLIHKKIDYRSSNVAHIMSLPVLNSGRGGGLGTRLAKYKRSRRPPKRWINIKIPQKVFGKGIESDQIWNLYTSHFQGLHTERKVDVTSTEGQRLETVDA